MTKNLLLLKEKSILFAEDDNISRMEMTAILEMFFHKVYSAKDGKEARLRDGDD